MKEKNKKKLSKEDKNEVNSAEDASKEENIEEEVKDSKVKGTDDSKAKEGASIEDELKAANEDLIKDNKKFKDENEKLNNELDAAKDRFMRLNAEYQNYRNRTSKEKEGIYTDACSDVINEMLPTLDNLERATAAEGSAEDLKKGVEMVIKQFKGSLKKLGIEEIPCDEGFDPNFHNAVMHIEDENYGENEIVEVLQKGYKKGNKVLRHSMVKVAN
ncbi:MULTISPECIES: nucleotide exchange factor GrpE [Clostridium]|uniref:nucleotide exchange factor GrpE n=1 Tax=Clostridium TaxID=1485 RepID=UPI000825729B|nr:MULTISPECIES: nucleotide exchange factor GrpE [Clostridium]PJI07088.1 nucleotide exchange factor GrpE [Clostridium sp. CT7]